MREVLAGAEEDLHEAGTEAGGVTAERPDGGAHFGFGAGGQAVEALVAAMTWTGKLWTVVVAREAQRSELE